ncbi:SAM-dependent methyltransferase [Azospirillum fermentarium]|uniref:class I SAM-dependent methyltransferase n=1 Tax=Azospirillum fermentarium TaxID=1233114 RepID=UPI0022270212|nr:class I SAM-dependent methyltransferase [Azospirillum fermentarium]MCW2249525.1 SAM-dependent methyltransferase [Azospirillum fermentarium]
MNKNSKEIDQSINEIYNNAIDQGKSPFERILCGEPARQYHRFNEIVALIGDLQRSDVSVLDFGCGNGEFYKFLNFMGFRGAYQGVDINARLIEEAKKRFPQGNFSNTNIDDLDCVADITVMSGIFNVNVGQNIDYVRNIIEKISKSNTSKIVIFNAISSYVNFKEEKMFYISPEDAIGIAASISPKFEIRHGFVPFNYTVAIHLDGKPWAGIEEHPV